MLVLLKIVSALHPRINQLRGLLTSTWAMTVGVSTPGRSLASPVPREEDVFQQCYGHDCLLVPLIPLVTHDLVLTLQGLEHVNFTESTERGNTYIQ